MHPVTITTHGPATYEDLLKLPENVVGEIVNGDLYASPRPGPRHADAEGAFFEEIRAAYQRGRGGPGGWRILIEPELHFRSDVLVPDIAGWRRQRMQRLPETAWFELSPDWVCEILSPSTGRLDRSKKLPIYARESVAFVWLVDPIEKTVEVMKLIENAWTIVHVYGGDEQMSAIPFEELTIDLRTVWS